MWGFKTAVLTTRRARFWDFGNGTFWKIPECSVAPLHLVTLGTAKLVRKTNCSVEDSIPEPHTAVHEWNHELKQWKLYNDDFQCNFY